MVKNNACLNTANCCVFKCSNVNNATTGVTSQRCSKGIFKIIHFLKTAEEKEPLENALNNRCHPCYNFHNLTPLHFCSLGNNKQ